MEAGVGRAPCLPRLLKRAGSAGARRGTCGSPGPLAEVEAVATGWMLDFACHSMCRHFCEGGKRAFERSRALALTLINGLRRIEEHQVKTVCLCELLAYVSEGKKLAYYEGVPKRSALENALLVWTSFLKTQSKQDKLFESIKQLIQIQAVAVFLENSRHKEAAEVLGRVFTESLSNEHLQMKLSALIKDKDPNHPFLLHYSFSLLNKKIKTYITNFLKEDSNNFLLKAAVKEVKTKLNTVVPLQCDNTDTIINGNNLEMINRSFEEASTLADQTFSKPEREQSYLGPKHRRKSTPPGRSALLTIENDQQVRLRTSQKKKRWSWEDDQKLKKGVRRFGVGNWTKILQHYDFKNRTSVMLKDRWRTMVRSGMI